MLSCKEIVTIVSSDEDVAWTKLIHVRFHLMMCRHCSRYAKQIKLLRSSAKQLVNARYSEVDELKLREIEKRAIDQIK